MKHRLVCVAVVVHSTALFFLGGLAGVTVFKKAMFNPTTQFPETVVYLYGSLIESDNFNQWSILDIIKYRQQGIRVEVTARVYHNQKSPDGDTHVVLEQGKYTVVGETVPGSCRPPDPPEGAVIVVRGFTRWDSSHFWWEIHPIISWRYATQEEISLFLKSEAETRGP